MLQYEAAFYWAAVTIYAIAAAIYLAAFVFKKERWLLPAAIITAVALLPHAVAILIRWVELGHGPYMSSYEVLSSNTWLAIVLFLVVQFKMPKAKLIGAVVLPISVIALGAGFYLSTKINYLPPSLRGYWLFIHIFFAKLAYDCFLIGLAFAVLILLRSSRLGNGNRLLSRVPPNERLDELSYRFSALGFLFLAVMIIAGSIWANQAWGRYWGWDMTETWSLITWLVYAIYLHSRFTYNWRNEKSAWFLIFGMVFVVITFFVLPYVPLENTHMTYFKGN